MQDLDTLYDWLQAVCDDLDPKRMFSRPELRDGDTSCYAGRKGFAGYVAIGKEKIGIGPHEIIAHECRHWFQVQSGMAALSPDWNSMMEGLTGMYLRYWKGVLTVSYARSQEDYEQLPWEKDANDYAADVCARLLDAHLRQRKAS